jgi:hypothetical protein
MYVTKLTRSRRPTIWINDAWAANEILVKRAGIYSSRPRMLMFAELGVGQSNLLHKYTYTKEQRERFRDLRKITHHGVGIQQVFIGNHIVSIVVNKFRYKDIATSRMTRTKLWCTSFSPHQMSLSLTSNAMRRV